MNPFLTNGYVSAEYFCGRIDEAKTLLRYLTNGNNAALISSPPRQKEVLTAICKEGKARKITFSRFLKNYKLTTSSVQEAVG